MLSKKQFFWFTVLILAGTVWLLSSVRREAVVCPVEVGKIRDSVTGILQVYPESTYMIRSKVNGIVKETLLKPFDNPIQVESNQTLIVVSIEDLNRSLNQALKDQKTDLDRFSKGSAIQLHYEIERKDLELVEALAKDERVSKHELEIKRNFVERLKIQYENEIIQRESVLRNHERKISLLREQIDDHFIRSPITGIFMESSVTPSDMVFHAGVVGKVVSPTRLIEVLLNEEELAGVKLGQEAAVTLFSFGKRIFPAVVSRMLLSVDPSSGERKLYLDIETDEELPIGGSGRAEIIKGIREKVLKIPRKALLGDSVFVVVNNEVEIRKVKTGARNLLYVEIINGLKEGDLVISETPHLFSDGEKVKVTVLNPEK